MSGRSSTGLCAAAAALSASAVPRAGGPDRWAPTFGRGGRGRSSCGRTSVAAPGCSAGATATWTPWPRPTLAPTGCCRARGSVPRSASTRRARTWAWELFCGGRRTGLPRTLIDAPRALPDSPDAPPSPTAWRRRRWRGIGPGAACRSPAWTRSHTRRPERGVDRAPWWGTEEPPGGWLMLQPLTGHRAGDDCIGTGQPSPIHSAVCSPIPPITLAPSSSSNSSSGSGRANR